jgi:hypothetical protein
LLIAAFVLLPRRRSRLCWRVFDAELSLRRHQYRRQRRNATTQGEAREKQSGADAGGSSRA